ncbi:MBL fold metallo-hydrolase [Curtobacterium ammoniigenes]|uniref:MBL fold metallo-hydrolase n=1 Tax=Curtobacterium ammoniigenes TaxID=395387 RepID=UPI00082FB529|nr:MBL fold metallo-hydrolase [Curtobacterium ammoniigenes]
MQLTKYTHATVVLTKDDVTIVIDPGTFTPEAEQLASTAAAVLVTHEHGDHLDVDAVQRALQAAPDLVVYAPEGVADQLGAADRVHTVHAGDAFGVGPFSVQVFGERHAVIHRDLPTIANVGYLVDGSVFHPGDAYLEPGVPVETLLIPTSGPWSSTAMGVDYIRAVAPKRAIQIHEAMLSELGQKSTARMLGPEGLGGVQTDILEPGTTVTL